MNDLLGPLIVIMVEIAEPPVGMKIVGEIGQVHERSPLVRSAPRSGFEDPRLVRAEMIGKDQVERFPGLRLILVVPMGVVPGRLLATSSSREAEQEEIVFPRLLGHLDRGAVAGSEVSAPFIMNFMLLVPLASYPAVEIWFETSAAGMQTLGERHVVFRQEHDLQLAANRRIVSTSAPDC